MGLDISGKYSNKTYQAGYGGLHRIRKMGLITLGYADEITEAEINQYKIDHSYLNRKDSPLDRETIIRMILDEWLYGNTRYKFSDGKEGIPPKITDDDLEKRGMWQLFHFSDCEGILIRDFFLAGIDYSDSYYLGSLDNLVADLEQIKDYAARHSGIFFEHELKLFFMLYDLAAEEVECGSGMLHFY